MKCTIKAMNGSLWSKVIRYPLGVTLNILSLALPGLFLCSFFPNPLKVKTGFYISSKDETE